MPYDQSPYALGNFHDEDAMLIASLKDKAVIVDTSRSLMPVKVAYARTSLAVYPHIAVKYSFGSKHREWTTLGVKPIFVFEKEEIERVPAQRIYIFTDRIPSVRSRD